MTQLVYVSISAYFLITIWWHEYKCIKSISCYLVMFVTINATVIIDLQLHNTQFGRTDVRWKLVC